MNSETLKRRQQIYSFFKNIAETLGQYECYHIDDFDIEDDPYYAFDRDGYAFELIVNGVYFTITVRFDKNEWALTSEYEHRQIGKNFSITLDDETEFRTVIGMLS